MTPEATAIMVFAGMVASLMGGYYLGFDWGRKQVMTREQAAKVMAKAMHAKRRARQRLEVGFFRSVNR